MLKLIVSDDTGLIRSYTLSDRGEKKLTTTFGKQVIENKAIKMAENKVISLLGLNYCGHRSQFVEYI